MIRKGFGSTKKKKERKKENTKRTPTKTTGRTEATIAKIIRSLANVEGSVRSIPENRSPETLYCREDKGMSSSAVRLIPLYSGKFIAH